MDTTEHESDMDHYEIIKSTRDCIQTRLNTLASMSAPLKEEAVCIIMPKCQVEQLLVYLNK